MNILTHFYQHYCFASLAGAVLFTAVHFIFFAVLHYNNQLTEVGDIIVSFCEEENSDAFNAHFCVNMHSLK